MRWLIALPILLALAGCSAEEPEPQGPEAPIAGPGEAATPPAEPDVFELKDSGTMLTGVDESWTFDIDPNATKIDIRITAVPIEGNRELMFLEAKALRNGSVFEDGSITGSQGSFGSASPVDLVEVVARASQRGLADHAGEWELVLRGGPQVADYEIDVHVLY